MKSMLQTNKAIKYSVIQPKLNTVDPIWLVKYILIFFFLLLLKQILR